MIRLAAILILLSQPIYADTPLKYFGFAAINCGQDDPHDDTDKTDYTDEVADFTNLNQVCFGETDEITTARLRNMARNATPLFYVEHLFFNERRVGEMHPNADTPALMPFLQRIITQSGVPPHDLIFYLADEPALRNLPLADLEAAAKTLRSLYPDTPVMVIEAYSPNGPPPIADNIQYWGFNAYTIPDPAADPRYTSYLDRASATLGPDQELVMVMDAQHTPHHLNAGLTEPDMADVAHAYHAYALRRGDVTALIGYTWAGGIDGDYEKGVRDMPDAVQEAHRQIGREITGK